MPVCQKTDEKMLLCFFLICVLKKPPCCLDYPLCLSGTDLKQEFSVHLSPHTTVLTGLTHMLKALALVWLLMIGGGEG